MLLLNINRKAYMGSPITLSHLTFVTLKGQSQGHSDFKAVCLAKEQSYTYHMLLLNISRKVYMRSSMTLSHMTLSDLETQSLGCSNFEALYHKGAAVRPYVTN